MTTQNNKSQSISSFIEELTGDSHLRIEDDLGDGFVRLKSSEAERRQAAQDIQCSEDIIIEMLRNSRDAHAKRIYLALQREDNLRTITIIDDGDGIPAKLHSKIFEPRVTSKLDSAHMDKWGIHGRGMALYSIAVNTLSSRVVSSEVNLGSSLQVTSDTRKLPEKTDQSSFPYFEVQADGVYAMRGPKNILRVASEFALEHRKQLSVWVGTPTEILATLIDHSKQMLDLKELIFTNDMAQVPLALRPGLAFDSESLVEEARNLGFMISSRTAYRILNGELAVQASLTERLSAEGMRNIKEKSSFRENKACRARKVKFEAQEIQKLENRILQAYSELAASHYLSSNIKPAISADADKLRITIPLLPLEDDES